MVFIPSSDIVIGDLPPLQTWQIPQHTVTVEAFCIDEYEYPNRKGTLPLFKVSYNESKSYCEALGKRLCFDTEWTRACRGNSGRLFSYGETKDKNLCHTKIEPEAKDTKMSPSGSFSNCVSPEGVYDLNGNVAEWIHDPFPHEQSPNFQKNQRALTKMEGWRTIRGGTAWSNTHYGQDCSSRHGHGTNWVKTDDGFRCCANPNQ
jgi:eukaryotic-like serine/threonine-protein kinase